VGDHIVADFVVLGVVLLLWGGLFAYVARLDRKLRASRDGS
jgi:hypothetical protein